MPTLTLGWGKDTPAVSPVIDRSTVAHGVSEPKQCATLDEPRRTHTKPKQAHVMAIPWWGVIASRNPKGPYHGPIFRHPTRETAEAEAAYLCRKDPSASYIVIEAVSWHGAPPTVDATTQAHAASSGPENRATD